MRLQALTRYGRMGASSRLRMMQFAPALARHGIDVRFDCLLDDRYLGGLYRGASRFDAVVRAYTRRLRDGFRSRNADVIWLEKEALPWVPAFIEAKLIPASVPIVSDYDDAIFHRYDQHESAIVRRLLGKKIDQVMARSALVMAGNRYLADRALAAGAQRVEVIPTVVDSASYQMRPQADARQLPVIGWIGTPSTWNEYMAPMLPLLTDVAARQGARLLVVGAGRTVAPHALIDSLPWSEESEVARIQQMDIGLMPLTDTPWARGKCGYKLIQYMACGLPVVASPVGVNCEIVEHGVNGFLASTDAEWRDAVGTLAGDAGLRFRMGAAGRRRVETQYSLQAWEDRIVELLRGTAGK
ncbi:glycosyltransferase family 4 protein [Thermomonas sp. S9]|uniref:glycosyltransferase family 4 protein n=1 Tax=Thermomonas sp. S9 TaxID=2885203 RepID=UPI00216B4CAA|nr:glycosyltransferase family 4 protein [Thermomonas sp. S9]MCR6496047.1 glycosyltransferase family 4 protein [Thermomonas sp. S9]